MAYVEQAEYDTFKGEVIQKLASMETAITNDARARAGRDSLITTQLQDLAQRIPDRRKRRISDVDRDDITGRFEVVKHEMTRATGRRQAAASGLAAATVMAAIEIIKQVLAARGH